MTIGEQIQKIRIEKGLTQERLAELLDVSRQSVSKWELGVSLSLGYQTILTLTIFYYSNSVVPVNPQHYINITVSEISEHVDNNHILWFGIPVLHSMARTSEHLWCFLTSSGLRLKVTSVLTTQVRCLCGLRSFSIAVRISASITAMTSAPLGVLQKSSFGQLQTARLFSRHGYCLFQACRRP